MHALPHEAVADAHPQPGCAADTGALAFCTELAQALARALDDAEIVIYLWREEAAVLTPVARAMGRGEASGISVVRTGRCASRGTPAAQGCAREARPAERRIEACARIGMPIRHQQVLLGLILADLRTRPTDDGAHRASLRLAADLAAARLAPLAHGMAHILADDAANEPAGAPDATREDFERVVREALRQLHDATRLRRCTLARSARVVAASAAGDDPGLACRRFLLEALDTVAAAPDLADQARLLRRRFVERAASQALLAEALHLGGSTLRRRVQRATALLASVLWREELAARQPDRPTGVMDGGPRQVRPAGIVQSIHASPASSAERADSSLRRASPQAL